MEITSLAYLLNIYAFILASWVTAGKAPELLGIQVTELPQFILIKVSIAPLLLMI